MIAYNTLDASGSPDHIWSVEPSGENARRLTGEGQNGRLENFNNGMERMNQVYDSGDYFGVYGSTLGELDRAWQASLETVPLSVDAEAFVAMVEEVAAAYERYASLSAGGHHYNYEAYLHLNQARLAANRGHLDEARSELEVYRSLMDG